MILGQCYHQVMPFERAREREEQHRKELWWSIMIHDACHPPPPLISSGITTLHIYHTFFRYPSWSISLYFTLVAIYSMSTSDETTFTICFFFFEVILHLWRRTALRRPCKAWRSWSNPRMWMKQAKSIRWGWGPVASQGWEVPELDGF